MNEKFNYVNTFFHQEPYLNILSPDIKYINSADIFISSDVFEHIIGDTLKAFENVYRILKPKGTFIFSVPYDLNISGKEHYRADLVGYNILKTIKNTFVVELLYENSEREIDVNPIFHGGPGNTLEIRLFDKDRIKCELLAVGFSEVYFIEENFEQYGVCWNGNSRIIMAKK